MRSIICAAALAVASVGCAAQAEPARFVIDPNHFGVVFSSDHVGFAPVLGMFLEGGGEFVYDEETKELSEARVTIKAASVFTNHDQRDEHLRSKDFLMAEAHPEITFVMTSAEATGDTTGTVAGDLTMRGETHPITLDVTLNKAAVNPFGGNYELGVSVRGVVKRSDWGSSYGVSNGAVGDEIPVTIEFEAIRQK